VSRLAAPILLFLLLVPVVALAVQPGDTLEWEYTIRFGDLYYKFRIKATVVDDGGELALRIDKVEIVDKSVPEDLPPEASLFVTILEDSFKTVEGTNVSAYYGNDIAEACNRLELLAPNIEGEYRDDNLYCKYEQGVLVEAKGSDTFGTDTIELEVQLTSGLGGDTLYLAALGALVIILVVAGILVAKKF